MKSFLIIFVAGIVACNAIYPYNPEERSNSMKGGCVPPPNQFHILRHHGKSEEARPEGVRHHRQEGARPDPRIAVGPAVAPVAAVPVAAPEAAAPVAAAPVAAAPVAAPPAAAPQAAAAPVAAAPPAAAAQPAA